MEDRLDYIETPRRLHLDVSRRRRPNSQVGRGVVCRSAGMCQRVFITSLHIHLIIRFVGRVGGGGVIMGSVDVRLSVILPRKRLN